MFSENFIVNVSLYLRPFLRTVYIIILFDQIHFVGSYLKCHLLFFGKKTLTIVIFLTYKRSWAEITQIVMINEIASIRNVVM